MKHLLWKLVLKIGRHDYSKEYEQINRAIGKNQLEELREERIKELLVHAYQNVPYYKKILREAGVVIRDQVDLTKFDQIPLLTKDIIRSNFESLTSHDLNTRRWYYKRTGGSTGEPVKFIHDDRYTKWKNAANKYYYSNVLGVDEDAVKKIILWGSEADLLRAKTGFKKKIMSYLRNTVVLNAFKMDEASMSSYVEKINSYKPYVIRGYSGALFELADYISRNSLTVHSPHLVISAAENLYEYMRRSISKTFQAPVYDFYGTREVGDIAGECQNGLMHQLPFNNFIEILDDRGQPATKGRVIVTNLHNYSFPFIRYEIGDLAELGPQTCDCKIPTPTLKELTGRVTDCLAAIDGSPVPSEFFIHFVGVTLNQGQIRQFQVVQKTRDEIEILFVPLGELPAQNRRDIETKIRLVMGESCRIVWKQVETIPKTKNGKYVYVKSLLSREREGR